MKYCKHCDTEKPKQDFPRNCKAKDGYAYICKSCKNRKTIEARKRRMTENKWHRPGYNQITGWITNDKW